MSFEKKLNKRLLSEAPGDVAGQPVNYAEMMGKPTPKPAAPTPAPQVKPGAPDFAAVRRSMRRPMVALDTAVHKIDTLLNQTQQDPSNLGGVVTQIEQSFNAMLKPLNAVKSGVVDLRNAASSFNAEYAGQGQPQQQQQQGEQQKFEAPAEEEKFINRIATDVEMSNREADKMYAAKQGFEAYRQHGGKMNRGEFFRKLVQKLKLPGEGEQPVEPQRRLPNVGATKRYGETGRRTGELQYRQGRTSPIESYTPTSSQRRMMQEAYNKHYSLGQLPQVPDEDRLLNKVVTEIEMVNNINDKKTAFRNGWLTYQEAGGVLNHSEFVKAVTNKLKMARASF